MKVSVKLIGTPKKPIRNFDYWNLRMTKKREYSAKIAVSYKKMSVQAL